MRGRTHARRATSLRHSLTHSQQVRLPIAMRRRGAAGAVPLYLLAASRQREVPDGARDLAVEQPTQKQSRHIGAETAHICPCAVRICPRTFGLGTAFEPLATTLARPTVAAHASVYGSASLQSAALARRLQLKPIGTSAPEFRELCRSPLKTTFATSRLQPTRAVERCVRRPAAPISVRTAVRLSTQPGSLRGCCHGSLRGRFMRKQNTPFGFVLGRLSERRRAVRRLTSR